MLRLDIRYALRNLARTPGFTAVAIATLAIGIGASAAVFSLVNGIMLQPYPYAAPDRLVRVRAADLEDGGLAHMSFPDYVDIADASTLLAGMAAVDREPYNLGDGDSAAYVQGAQVSANLFDVLGTTFLLGRGFRADDDTPGSPAVVILGETLWRNNFAADPDIIGKQVTIDAEPHTVIGVVPVGGGYPDEAALWVPLRIDRDGQRRDSRWANVIGRLAPAATLAQAQTEASALAANLASEYPDTNEGVGIRLVGLYESRTGDMQTLMALMLGAVAFVLLIVCANVASLMLSRAATRERELAVRAAMGASRLRIVRQLVTEAAVLALSGSLLGLVLGAWTVSAFTSAIPVALPEWVDFTVDWRVVAFTAAAAALATLLFGLAPAINASRSDLNRSLKESAPTGTRGKRRTRAVLVVAEVALSIVLLVGAGMMIRSLLQVSAVDTGYDTDNTFMFTTAFSDVSYGEPQQRLAFYRRAREELLSLPGVREVGGIAQPPLRGGWSFSGFVAEGDDSEVDEAPLALTHAVTPGYVEAAGIPLLRGRDLQETDSDADAPEAALVNAVLAERYWPGEDALGKRLRFSYMEEGAWIEVVGVTAATKHIGLEEEAVAEIFYPYERWASFFGRITWMVRTDTDPATVMAAARDQVQQLDPNQAVYDLMTMQAAVNESIWEVRFFTTLFWIFGAIAILLAAIGLYGLIAYGVSQRRHEIGVRRAMGAQSGNVLAMILRQGLLLATIGGAVGFAGALVLSRALASELYAVSPTEPSVYIGVAVLLAVVAVAASYLPALRATRVDPLVALRDEQ
jgi:putative ABC transport system permease protein